MISHAIAILSKFFQPMSELFEMFPHESGIVMQRGIEIGVIFSSFLISHCLYILSFADRATSPFAAMDLFFECALFSRVILSIPRPYVWLSTWKRFVRARRQPTPEQVTRALTGIYNNQNGLEKFLLYFYYGWLGTVSVISLLTPYRTPLGSNIWRHVLLNFGLIIIHRVICIGLFYYLVNSDIPRGLHQSVLEDQSTVVEFSTHADFSAFRDSPIASTSGQSGPPECSICYCEYEVKEQIRILKCGHDYHKSCIDQWLTRHRNRCPMCLHVVGSS